jgi:acyl-CoA reductase-like NAD-dependent aldehyde dehydrogenase
MTAQAALQVDPSTIVSTNPGRNYEVVGEVRVSAAADIAVAVRQARAAQPAWQELGVAGRVKALGPVASLFEQHRQEIAELIAREMGIPAAQADGSTSWALNRMRWNLDNAAVCLAPEVTFENAEEIHKVFYEPLGVAAVIAPWNFPQSNFVMGAFQPLLAGNTVVYKLSEEVPMFGQLLDRLMAAAKLPAGVFTQVYGDGRVGEALVRSDIDAIFFTGSSAVGRKLYKIGAEKFIPVHLELGGSDAGIVCEDANIDEAVPQIFDAKFCNNGQICCGLKRLIVHATRFDETVQKLAAYIKARRIGDPLQQDTELGPLVAQRQVDLLKAQVEDARTQGATIVVGGRQPPGLKGAYYEPTLITGVKPGMRVWKEEVFGPVLPVVSYKTEEEAITLANDTIYGLSGYIYTASPARAEKLASLMQTGSISHNGTEYLGPHNPFGGYKMSGLRKTGGKYGFRDACSVKAVCLRK